ncbi:MAG: DegT/DnrJ/EryC1/StrS family aminotransferase [Woeseiaceae bacterium]|nr:DegT/DnrJ/EryC1/StrS family aminotransferase [Woeseiaceae bacterium]
MANDQPFIVFGAPDIQSDEIEEVVASLQARWIGTGPKVAQFERDFAAYAGVADNRVAAVNSCTAALHVSMIAAGLPQDAEVLTTAMTFCATANAIIHAGATPVPVDIDPDTLNIDIGRAEQHITPHTRAIVPVHFAGRPCDMDELMAFADRHDLLVIEDCAHAIESEWRGKRMGTFGNFGCFSFYATKNVVTGEGGLVLARSNDDIDRIKVLALHGMSKDAWKRFSDDGYRHYDVVEAGFKYNMMDLQAALGIHQLRRVETSHARRETIWKLYQDAFTDLPVSRPLDPAADTRHAFHLYTLRIDAARCGLSRDEFIDRMTAAGIGVGVHYRSLPEHTYYQEQFGWKADDYPAAKAFGEQTVSLPLGPGLTDAEVGRIIDTVSGLLER